MINKCRERMVQGDYIMGNIFHKKGIGTERDFWYDWRRIKKLKRRTVSLDQELISYLVYYFLEKHF